MDRYTEAVGILKGLLTDQDDVVCIQGSDEDRALIQRALDTLDLAKIESTKDVWVAWTNSNLTDGYGREKPLAICEYKSTANRLGKKGYVQGTDCPVKREKAAYLFGRWMSCVDIIKPSDEDLKVQQSDDAMAAAEQKAMELGLSAEEVMAIKG